LLQRARGISASSSSPAARSPLLSNSLGVLGPEGFGSSTFSLPAGTDPSLAGATLHHAFVVLTFAPDGIALASNAVAVELVP
jgi:hypothetical protein